MNSASLKEKLEREEQKKRKRKGGGGGGFLKKWPSRAGFLRTRGLESRSEKGTRPRARGQNGHGLPARPQAPIGACAADMTSCLHAPPPCPARPAKKHRPQPAHFPPPPPPPYLPHIFFHLPSARPPARSHVFPRQNKRLHLDHGGDDLGRPSPAGGKEP